MAKLTYNEIHSIGQDEYAYCDNCHHQARNHEIDYQDNDTFCRHSNPKTGEADCHCRCFSDYDNWKPKNKKEVDNWDEDVWFYKHAKMTRELKKSWDNKPYIEIRHTFGSQSRIGTIFDFEPQFQVELKKIK